MRHIRFDFSKTLLIAALGIGLVALTACEGSGGDGEAFGGGLSGGLKNLKGKLGSLGQGSKAKVSVMVGGKQIPATIDAKRKTFEVGNLPPGPKSLVVKETQADGTEREMTLKFPKSKLAAGTLSGVIPDAKTADGSLDLGTVQPAEDGSYLISERNPLHLLDSDGDGDFDYFDDDIDGDGTPNAEDADPFGFEGFGWSDELAADWDCDGDGYANWEDSDFEGEGFWDWDDVDSWDVCADDDAACWLGVLCQAVPSDPLCEPGMQSALSECGDDYDCLLETYCKDATNDPFCAELGGELPTAGGCASDDYDCQLLSYCSEYPEECCEEFPEGCAAQYTDDGDCDLYAQCAEDDYECQWEAYCSEYPEECSGYSAF